MRKDNTVQSSTKYQVYSLILNVHNKVKCMVYNNNDIYKLYV